MRFWFWLLQRLSGLLLLVLLPVHIVLTHFITPDQAIQFATVKARLSMSLIMGLDYALLFAGLFHALYGLFIVLQDISPVAIPPKPLGVALSLLGTGLGISGVYILGAFLV